MCLAIPMRLIERGELEGVVEIDGVRRQISLMLLPDAEVGEFVLVHTGYAIQRIDEDEARETLALLREYMEKTEVM
ncbi:MAG: HypC/HybG/HupF family hydrogenase formation chaperone [Acidobacteria bacterium]|nr:HypC/HybG/HupF family hydrogenase formation chaperone [Acidobacteriota bacterium]